MSFHRPKRERKIPAHLKSGDFESSFVDSQRQQSLKGMVKASADSPQDITNLSDAEKSERDKEDKAEEEEEDDEGEEDEDEDEDDPERLWCVCKQPHNNRFMICCDTCLEWFHGKCVGISKEKGKEMEESGNEWRCPKCKESIEAAQNEVKRQELTKKLKEREEEKKKRAEAAARKRQLPPLKRSSKGGEESSKVGSHLCRMTSIQDLLCLLF